MMRLFPDNKGGFFSYDEKKIRIAIFDALCQGEYRFYAKVYELEKEWVFTSKGHASSYKATLDCFRQLQHQLILHRKFERK